MQRSVNSRISWYADINLSDVAVADESRQPQLWRTKVPLFPPQSLSRSGRESARLLPVTKWDPAPQCTVTQPDHNHDDSCEACTPATVFPAFLTSKGSYACYPREGDII